MKISRPRPVLISRSFFDNDDLEYEFDETDFPTQFPKQTELDNNNNHNHTDNNNNNNINGAFNGINLYNQSRRRLRLCTISVSTKFDFAHLPDDLLTLSILTGFLNTLEILSCVTLINKRFRRLSIETVRRLDLNSTKVQKDQLIQFLSNYQNIYHLNLSNCMEVEYMQNTIPHILLKLPLLKSLIVNSSSIIPEFISSNDNSNNNDLAIHKNLEHLNISCTKGNILNVLKSVTNKLPNLKIFIASNMKKVENIINNEEEEEEEEEEDGNDDDNEHEAVAVDDPPVNNGNQTLNNDNVSKTPLFNFGKLPNLIEIDLSCNVIINDDVLASLASTRGKFLKALNISGCNLLTDKSIDMVMSKMSSLEYLNVSFLGNITTEAFHNIYLLKELKKLDVSHTKNFTDSCLKHVARLNKLQNLNANGCLKVTNCGIGFISQIQSLEHVNCASLPLVKADGLILFTNLVNLKSLDVQYYDERISRFITKKLLPKLALKNVSVAY